MWASFEYIRRLNYTLSLHKFLNKMFHLNGLRFLNIPKLWIYQGSKYARITQGSSKNTISYKLDRIPNIPQVSNMTVLHKVLNKTLYYNYLIGFWIFLWQGYREFWVNCILEIHGILDMSQALNIPRFWMYRES